MIQSTGTLHFVTKTRKKRSKMEQIKKLMDDGFEPIDRNIIVSGSCDNTIRRWNRNTGALIGEPLRGHTGDVYADALTPNRDMIASASEDKTIRRCNSSTGEPIGEPLRVHTDWILAVEVGTSGDMIVSASKDATIRR